MTLKLYTKYSSDIAMFCAKLQSDWATGVDFMEEWNFEWDLSYIAYDMTDTRIWLGMKHDDNIPSETHLHYCHSVWWSYQWDSFTIQIASNAEHVCFWFSTIKQLILKKIVLLLKFESKDITLVPLMG